MISPKDFAKRWGKKPPLVRFIKKAVESLAIAEEDMAFLTEAGLPKDAAPELGFTAPKSGELPTVAEQYDLSAKFRRYRVIASSARTVRATRSPSTRIARAKWSCWTTTTSSLER